jgi:hypothetical protein
MADKIAVVVPDLFGGDQFFAIGATEKIGRGGLGRRIEVFREANVAAFRGRKIIGVYDRRRGRSLFHRTGTARPRGNANVFIRSLGLIARLTIIIPLRVLHPFLVRHVGIAGAADFLNRPHGKAPSFFL